MKCKVHSLMTEGLDCAENKKLPEQNISVVGYKEKSIIEKVSVKKKNSYWRFISTFWRPLLNNDDSSNWADKEPAISEH